MCENLVNTPPTISSPEDKKYSLLADNIDPVAMRGQLVSIVRTEIIEHQQGIRPEITSTLYIAEATGRTHRTIRRYLVGQNASGVVVPEYPSLTEGEHDYRKGVINNQSHLRSLKNKQAPENLPPHLTHLIGQHRVPGVLEKVENIIRDEMRLVEQYPDHPLTGNGDFHRALGVCYSTFQQRYLPHIDSELRAKRAEILNLRGVIKAGTNSIRKHGPINDRLTPVERSEISKRAYDKGLGRLTRDELVAAGRKSQRMHGNPSRHFTDEQRVAYGKRAGEANRRASIVEVDDIRYHSMTEAASVLLANKYLPAYEIIEGETFQVPIGGGVVDAVIDDVIVEIHPPVLSDAFGHFESTQEWEKFKAARNTYNGLRRSRYKDKVRALLTARYLQKRVKCLDTEREIIVITTPSELYSRILCRWGIDIPDEDSFIAEYYDVYKNIREEVQRKKKSKPAKKA